MDCKERLKRQVRELIFFANTKALRDEYNNNWDGEGHYNANEMTKFMEDKCREILTFNERDIYCYYEDNNPLLNKFYDALFLIRNQVIIEIADLQYEQRLAKQAFALKNVGVQGSRSSGKVFREEILQELHSLSIQTDDNGILLSVIPSDLCSVYQMLTEDKYYRNINNFIEVVCELNGLEVDDERIAEKQNEVEQYIQVLQNQMQIQQQQIPQQIQQPFVPAYQGQAFSEQQILEIEQYAQQHPSYQSQIQQDQTQYQQQMQLQIANRRLKQQMPQQMQFQPQLQQIEEEKNDNQQQNNLQQYQQSQQNVYNNSNGNNTQKPLPPTKAINRQYIKRTAGGNNGNGYRRE